MDSEQQWLEPTYDEQDLDDLIAEDELLNHAAQYHDQLDQVDNDVNQHLLNLAGAATINQSSNSTTDSHQSSHQGEDQANHSNPKRKLSIELSHTAAQSSVKRAKSSVPSVSDVNDVVESAPTYTRQWVFHRQPVAGEFITVKDSEGQSLFLSKSDHIDYQGHGLADGPQSNSSGLLDADIRAMLSEIEDTERQRAIALSLEMNNPMSSQQQTRTANSSRLWVDKYSPQRFTELLSPDEINRGILSWLLQWDACVFGEDRQQARKRHDMHPQQKLKAQARKPSQQELLASRPSERILLLSGPAGLGKTTLAHIVATHAGYSVIELNASDDRTEDVLIEKVRGGVEYSEASWGRSGMKHGKPHCLVLDEIDGIADTGGEKNAIVALCKLVSADVDQKSKKSDDTNAESDSETSDDDQQAATEQPKKGRARGNKSKSRALPPLRRPIICICNDPWIPALRPLRAIATHFKVGGSNRDALLARLKYIAKNERMSIEDRALSALIERVSGDVRSAIHSLQFLHERKGSSKLTTSDLANLSVGVKDMQSSRQDLIERVFSNPALTSKKLKGSQLSAAQADPVLVRDLNRSHDTERLVMTMHQNYLLLPPSDARLSTMSQLSHSFSALDERGGMYDDDGDDTSNGLTYLALRIHSAASRLTRAIRLDLNTSVSYALFQRSMSHNAIATAWLLDSENEIARTGCTIQRACVEMLSHIFAIISPQIRPLPFASLSKSERKRIDCVIKTMSELALTYRPDTTHTMGFVHSIPFVIHPRIDHLCKYEFTHSVLAIAQPTQHGNYRMKRANEQPAQTHYDRTASLHMSDFDALSHKVRQMLAREIEIEQMRKSEGQRPHSQTQVIAPSNAVPQRTKAPPIVPNNIEPSRPRMVTFLSEHSAKIKARNAPKQAASRQADSLDPLIATRSGGFHFAYKEGFTQAVRRPVKHGFFT